MEKFYKLVKISGERERKFTGNRIIVDGVKLYWKNNKVILEGSYSEECFNVKKLLYDFLKLTWNIQLKINVWLVHKIYNTL